MKKLQLTFLVIIVISIITLVSTGCRSGKNKVDEREVIKIGAILPLTGSLSVMGEVEKKAMILAADQLNNEGKIIEILFEDSKSSATGAVSAANKLIDIDQVDMLITSTTGASLAVEPIATQRRINFIAFCMDPDVAGKSLYSTRYYLGIQEEAEAIKNYFNKGSNAKKVGILFANVPALEKAAIDIYQPFLNKLGIEVPFVDRYAIGETDFRTIVLKMKNLGIDHLIILGYGFEYPSIFSEMNNQRMIGKITVMGGWGFLYTSVPYEQLEGVLVSGPEYVFRNKDIAAEFSKIYSERYGDIPNFDAAFAYNVIMSMANNFNKKQIRNVPLKESLIKKGQLKGVVGNYHFDANGNMIVPTGLGIIKEGKIIPFE